MQNLNFSKLFKLRAAFSSGMFFLCFVIIYSIENSGSNDKIWIEVEDAGKIISPLQIIESKGASGGKAIVSRLQSHQTEAFASYTFKIVKRGNYFMWTRAFWPGGCNNSYKIKVDNSRTITIGNDNNLNVWHWIPCPAFELENGNHSLYLWNDEIDAQLDKFLFTSDPYYKPIGQGEIANYFADFENGMPTFIQLKSPELWELVEENENNSLILKNNLSNSSEMALMDRSNFNEYFFSCNLKCKRIINNECASIFFNYVNGKNFYRIDLTDNGIKLNLITQAKEKKLYEINSFRKLIDTTFHKFSVIYRYPEIVLKRDGSTLVTFKDTTIRGGKNGFGSKIGSIYFDDIEYDSDLKPLFQESFFMMSMDKLFEGERTLKWNFHQGDWNLKQNVGIMSLRGRKKAFKEALVTTGNEYWKDYYFVVAIKTFEAAGICFYVQNSENYYLLKIERNKNKSGVLKLSGVVNNKERLIKEVEINLLKDEWYKLSVQIKNDSILAFLDGGKMIKCTDKTFVNGGIGLWSSDSVNYTYFDDLVVNTIDKIDTSSCRYKYAFEMRERAGLDFCDWINSKVFTQNTSGQIISFEKNLFEEPIIMNKKTFLGNFKIKVKLGSRIPVDVNADIIVRSKEFKDDIQYKLVLKTSELIFMKNSNILVKKDIKINRQNYSLEYKNGIWVFSSDDSVITTYTEDSKLKSINLGIGYSGIGAGHININGIDIKANSCTN